MKYIAAYILLSLGGKKDVTEKDLAEFFKNIGAQADDAQIKNVVDTLKGKCLNDLATKGLPKLASLSFGSGSSSGAQASGPAKGDAPAKKEDKKEAKKEEAPPAEEAADFDLGDMFG